MSRLRPIELGFFNISADADAPPSLLGSYSPATKTYFFPRRRICPISGTPVEDCELSTTGVLYSWTFIHENRVGTQIRGNAGYGMGQIDLPEGPRIQARLVGEIGDWTIGMAMQTALLEVRDHLGCVIGDESGVAYATFCFKPAGTE